jgi:trehalose/maltose hydrolase-like predicted phosphorylase
MVTRDLVALPAKPETDPEWVLIEEGFVLTREHEIESLFAIGNGLVGSKGYLSEGSALSAPETFVAGVFERSSSQSIPALASMPDWAHLAGAVDGNAVRLDAGESLEHRRVLDMRQGVLWRLWRHRNREGRITRIEGMRLASLADRHLLVQSVAVTPENYSGAISAEVLALSQPVVIRTASGVSVEFVAGTRVEEPDATSTEPPKTSPDERGQERWTGEVDIEKTYRLDRLVCVSKSRDSGGLNKSGTEELQRAEQDGINAAVEAHRAAWRARWDAADVVIEGDPDSQRAIRFAAYHLISAANPEDEHVSIGARALTGSVYNGHVFWDTEIFMLPFFTFTYPEAARALLMYRYHTLPAARAKAARLGYRGALYAWESADTGEEVTPSAVVAPTGEVVPVLAGEQEQHISADVAYAVWQYWQATADERFLLEAGAEVLFETARFWASRARCEDDGRYHIRRVVGPDEYHESIDDNAYTNGMAQWNLEVAVELASLLAERWPDRWQELARRLGIASDEVQEWRRAAERMYLKVDPQTGIIEQFKGYFELESIDLAAYEPRTAPMDVLLGRERTQRSQVVKQADVVMLIYLLWDRFPASVREANFRYYEPRTGHGSSLSPAIHAAVAARLGDLELASKYFRQAAEIDLSNGMGNAAGGVHAATLGGLWQALVFGFAGVQLSSDGPRVEQPRLPSPWRRLRFTMQWREKRFPVDLRQEGAET